MIKKFEIAYISLIFISFVVTYLFGYLYFEVCNGNNILELIESILLTFLLLSSIMTGVSIIGMLNYTRERWR